VRSLRWHQFAAIVVAVVVSVGVSLFVAATLVRRSAQHEAIRTLARQAALIAEQQRSSPAGERRSNLGAFFDTQQEILAIEALSQVKPQLPPAGRAELAAGRPAQGSVVVSGSRYLYAAHPVGRQAVVLLRPAKLESGELRPYTLAFGIAAAVGIAIAAAAAFIAARAIARPIERVSEASLALAAGERLGPLPVAGATEVANLSASFNRLAEDLDHARDAERSFLLSVSHELKTPLAAIRGHGEALLDGVIAVPKGAAVIIQESKRLERLVRDLLDLGRLSQRSFSVEPRPVDLAEVVDEAIARHEAEAARVRVELTGDADRPAPALADPDRTLQVLSNLIENALRSTPAGGSITVAARPGRLTVADDGPGLEPEELPRAFERFFLYSRYARNRAVGTGLGLAIVKELTDAMGGSISVASTPGAGTTFSLALPLPQPLEAAPAGVGRASIKRSL
jgi:two-component system sensor histidine kinase BaeS